MDVANPGIGSEISDTALLRRRVARKPNWRIEKEALGLLNRTLSIGPEAMLRQLASLGLELCQAGTAGISIIEKTPTDVVFRWKVLAGCLRHYEGGQTPRHFSPCGGCLDSGRPVLYSFPARRFPYFADLEIPILEGLVIPLFSEGIGIGTIWIVSHTDHVFDAEDVRIMTSLGRFCAAVLRPAAEAVATDEQAHSHSVMGGGLASDRQATWCRYMARIVRNDEAALTALYREAEPFVFHTALSILSFPADADETTADVFGRVWRSAHLFNEHAGVLPWLLAITRNLAFDRLRRRKSGFWDGDAASHMVCRDASPEMAASTAEFEALLLECLHSLPPAQRLVIELAYFSELSHLQIAAELNEPVGTIKTRIRLGLLRLRRLMATASGGDIRPVHDT